MVCVVGINNLIVGDRLGYLMMALIRLERNAGKLARCVLRGTIHSNVGGLLADSHVYIFFSTVNLAGFSIDAKSTRAVIVICRPTFIVCWSVEDTALLAM